MKPEHAISMLAHRGHKITKDEPFLILLKLVDGEELIRRLPQDRGRVKMLLFEHGYRISDDDPIFLALDLLQIQYWALESRVIRRGRKHSVKSWTMATALSAVVGLVGLITGIWLSNGRIEPSYWGVGATGMMLSCLAVGCGWLVWRRDQTNGT